MLNNITYDKNGYLIMGENPKCDKCGNLSASRGMYPFCRTCSAYEFVVESIKMESCCSAEQELKQLKENLKSIELVTSMASYEDFCPACRAWGDNDHKEDCWLNKAIKQ